MQLVNNNRRFRARRLVRIRTLARSVRRWTPLASYCCLVVLLLAFFVEVHPNLAVEVQAKVHVLDVALTSKTQSSIAGSETSNVPPPRSKIGTFHWFGDTVSSPNAIVSAFAALIMGRCPSQFSKETIQQLFVSFPFIFWFSKVFH